ncbi:protein AF-10 isoform X3 [Carassius auratus]|uniref:Protein AF-10 isoform X3 n=1 Tax=Carassius auratus TaxID=7957 RepID=A0A6P6J9A4_CARAU|nr:protein AF-10 isoform X3 [Carassius auratus]
MVSSELYLAEEDDDSASNMKEMIGGCCVCSDERGWAENPLVYCDGHGCNVAVHQACYGIVQVPTGPWFCRKCESQERAARVIKGWRGRKPSWQTPEEGRLSTTCKKEEEDSRLSRSLKTLNIVRCELCPHKDGALKRTDNGGWAHVVCALYIPEVEFANVSTMEPIVLQSVPHERYNKTCHLCEEQGRESKAATGACMTCNKHGCRQAFHVTCAQFAGLLCEEQGSDADNVKYCGYCKYHYSKLRRSKGRGSRAQCLSDSSTHSLDKHHDKEKKKHKERDRHKPKHKKALELSPSLVPALMVTSEKSYNSSSGGSVSSISSAQKRLDDSGGRFTNANFQEVPSHSSSSSKDGSLSDGKSSDGKSKKSSSHSTSSSSGSRGRKSTPGKPHGPVVTTATSSTAPSSTSPFQQGLLLGSSSSKSATSGSVVQPTSDFLSFSDPSLRAGDSYTPPSFSRCHMKGGVESTASEGMVALNTFGMMSLPQSSSKHYENCHPAGELGGLASAGYKRPQPSSSSSSATSSSSTGEDGVKKKKRGNWRNRYGPCFTTQDSKTTDTGEHGSTMPSSTSPSPSSMSTMSCRGSAVSSTAGVGAVGAGSSSLGIQKSPSLLRNGSLQGMTVSSSPAGPGSYSSSSDVACPLPSAVFGGSLSGSNSELPAHQSVVTSMSTLTSLPPTAPFTSTSSTHSNSLPGSFNLAPSHMFGNRLNPNSAMAALIAQSEGSPADQELGDGALGFSRRGNSPKTNLSPRSPLSGLHIRYDSSGPLVPGLGSGSDTLPPVATSIDQLLDRQWNDGQQFLFQQGSQGDVLGMLKSLHQLQVENRRLEEQIRTLTMKKERLQLLSAQLSVPFTPASTTATTASSPLYPSNTHADMLHSKSIQLGSSVLTESSQPLPTQVTSSTPALQMPSAGTEHLFSTGGASLTLTSLFSLSLSLMLLCFLYSFSFFQHPLSGGHSSGSSTSSLSTPPSAAHSPPQQQVNGVGMAGVAVQPGNANSTLPAIAGVTGLMGALQGNHLAMSGIVGTLNGVIQTSPSLPQNSSPLPHPSAATSASLPMSNSLSNSSMPAVKTSAARLFSDQHRQIFLHQHQLQQLFSSQQVTPEQQQALLYQLMQQQQQQQQNDIQLQQLPINSLLPTTTTNPFLTLHNDSNTPKTGRLGEKAVSVTGQEKT